MVQASLRAATPHVTAYFRGAGNVFLPAFNVGNFSFALARLALLCRELAAAFRRNPSDALSFYTFET